MDTCASPYLLPYLLPVPFLGCVSLSADTGSDPFIRKQIRCRWPTSKNSHLYSAATTNEEVGLFIDQALVLGSGPEPVPWDVSQRTDTSNIQVPFPIFLS